MSRIREEKKRQEKRWNVRRERKNEIYKCEGRIELNEKKRTEKKLGEERKKK